MSDEINFYLNEDGEKNFWFHGIWNNLIQKNIWERGQDNTEAYGFIREFLQRCSGDNIVEMLNGLLSENEKMDLVKPENPNCSTKIQTGKETVEDHPYFRPPRASIYTDFDFENFYPCKRPFNYYVRMFWVFLLNHLPTPRS